MYHMKRLFANGLCLHACRSRNYNVTVVGGASDIGQTVCMLLKTQPAITRLSVYDNAVSTPGVVMDLSHIPTETGTKCFITGNIDAAVKDADIILGIGNTLTPSHSQHDLLIVNSEFINILCRAIGRGPMPFVGILAEPLNSLVPMAAELLKVYGTYDPKKLFGLSGVAALRAQALYASEHDVKSSECYVPIIGGHSEKTIIPLTSKSTPPCKMIPKRIHDYTNTVRMADKMITNANNGYAPTVSTACSCLLFTHEVLNALMGEDGQVQAYVENNDFGTSFFSGLVVIDRNGMVEMMRYTNLSQYEFQLLEESLIELRKEIANGRKILEMS